MEIAGCLAASAIVLLLLLAKMLDILQRGDHVESAECGGKW
jgi:hypothetical protein